MSNQHKTAARQARLAEVLDLAMERPATERVAAIGELSAGDADLAAEALSLLRALEAAGHLLEPARVPPPLKPLTGLRIGPYQIGDRVGAGGMGVVYRAADTRLGRTVAVKALPDSVARDPARRARLEREARVLAACNHPNLAAIHSIEDCEHGPVLVLEHVEGQTLSELVGHGSLPSDEVRSITRQILLALETAHDAGIVHRDMKPGNVMVTAEGVVKVLDFGIAKQRTGGLGGGADGEGVPAALGVVEGSGGVAGVQTVSGSFAGTAGYMSPEQARGRATDRRTDIWAVGCIIYEMLSGRQAFEGETISDTIAGVLRAEPDWTLIPATVPRGVVGVLRRCLAKEPDRRMRDAGDVRIELEEAWEEGTAVGPAGAARDRFGMLAWWGACVLGAILGVGGAVVVGLLQVGRDAGAAQRTGSGGAGVGGPTPTRMVIDMAAGNPLRSGAQGGCVAVSPDGQSIVFSAGLSDEPGPRLFIHRLDAFDDTPIVGTEHGFTPFFSPDGRSLGFTDLRIDGSCSLKRVALDGGPVQTVAVMPGLGFGASWGDDGSIIVADIYGIKRIPTSGGVGGGVGPPIEVMRGDPQTRESFRNPDVLPGSQTALLTCMYPSGEGMTSRIEAVTLGTGQRRVVVEDASTPRYVPGMGLLIFHRQGSLLSVPFDPQTLALKGEPTTLTPAMPSGTVQNVQFGVSVAGTLAYVLGPDPDNWNELAWFYSDGRTEPIFHASGAISTLRLSPTADRIAFSTRNPKPGLWILDVDRKTTVRVSPNDGDEFPVWTPDGKRVAFSTKVNGVAAIAWAPTDASAAAEMLYSDPGRRDGFPTGFSPDGKELLISMTSSPSGNDTDVFVLKMPDGPGAPPTQSVRRVFATAADRVAARFSPDGNMISYSSSETGQSEIYVQDYPEIAWKVPVSSGGGERAAWSWDGSTLFFKNYDRVLSAAVSRTGTVSFGKPSLLLTRVPFSRYDPAPDGAGGYRFLMSRPSGDWKPPTRMYVITRFADGRPPATPK